MKGYEKYKEVGLPWLKEIPEGWNIDKLKRLFYIDKDLSDIENPVVLSLARDGVKIRDITNNQGQMAASYKNYNKVKIGDLLLNPMDLYSGANCNVSYVEGVISPAYIKLRKREELCERYFDYWFKLQYTSLAFQAVGKGVSKDNRWTLTNETLMNYQSPIPSLYEQEQIANFLDWKIGEIDKLIVLEQKKINEIKSLKTKIIDKYMSIESDYSVKLKFLGKFVKGRGIARENLSDLGKYPVILYGDIYTKYNFSFSEVINKVDFDVFDNAIKVHENTLLFPTSGETKEDIGKTVLYEGKKSVAIGGDVLSFTISSEEINANYLMYYLNSSESLAYKYVNGRGDIIVHISEPSLNEIVVNFPSIDKQIYISDKISQKFDEIEMLLNNTIKQISYLEELKQTLISDAVTGKIDVRDIKIPHIFTERRKANEFNRKRI